MLTDPRLDVHFAACPRARLLLGAVHRLDGAEAGDASTRRDRRRTSCGCCCSGGLAGSGSGEADGNGDVCPSDDGPRSSETVAAWDDAALGACEVVVEVLADGDDHGYGLVLSAGDEATELGRRPPSAIDDRFGCMYAASASYGDDESHVRPHGSEMSS